MLLILSGVSFAESMPNRERNVVYAEVHGVGLVMDIFLPTAKGNGLGIVDVISGSWDSNRSKLNDHERAEVFKRLCGRGYTVFAIRPGSVSKFTIDEMVEHLELGVRWVKERAEGYELDANRLGLMGASAGGHLASLLAVRNGKTSSTDGMLDSSVKAVAVFFPPTDLLDFAGRQIDESNISELPSTFRQAVFGSGIEPAPSKLLELLEQASPARCVTAASPPFLLIHGTADPIVPLAQSEKMVQALNDHNVPNQFITKPGGGHPWPTIYEEVEVFADWFDEQLKGR
jgi:acetyl esterase/lipase